MTRVLVVDDDESVRTVIARDLARHSYEVLIASSVAEATTLLRSSKVDVLLTDLRISADGDGIDILHECRRTSTDTRSVLMSAYATAQDYKLAMELGAVTVLCKPFTPSELVGAIRQAAECAKGFHGKVHGLSLVDILQVLHFGRRDVTVSISGAHHASIHMRGGEIIHAKKGARVGEEAVREILSASSGAVSTNALADDVPQTITRSFEGLLLDSMRVIDEESRDFPRTADPLFSLPPPAPARESSYLADRAAPLWRALADLPGLPLARAIVVAFDDTDACALAGSVDPAPYAAAARALVSAARRLEPGEKVIECTRGGVGIGVIMSDADGLGIALFDVLATGSAATWFRSHVAAMARNVLGETSR